MYGIPILNSFTGVPRGRNLNGQMRDLLDNLSAMTTNLLKARISFAEVGTLTLKVYTVLIMLMFMMFILFSWSFMMFKKFWRGF